MCTSSHKEHSDLLFFGFLVARWQADELLLFSSLSLARRHCQGLGIKGSNWIKWGYQKVAKGCVWCYKDGTAVEGEKEERKGKGTDG